MRYDAPRDSLRPHRRPGYTGAALLALTFVALGCEPRELPPLAPPMDIGPADAATGSDAGVQAPAPTLSPASGPMSGYFEVRLDLSEQAYGPEDVQRVELGGLAGIYLTPEGDGLRFMVQGHPEPGAVPLVVQTPGGEQTVPDAFTYDPPRVAGIQRIAAVGASISQGFQSGAITAHGTLGSPPTWVARQLGAHIGLPLVTDGLFPAITLDDLNAPPLCDTPDVTGWVTRSVGQLVPKLTAVNEDNLPIAAGGRVDPTLIPSHLAISGSTVADVLYGPMGGGSTVIGHLVYEPYATIFDPVTTSPLDRAEALAPDILLAIDFYGNDVLLEEPPDDMAEEEALRALLVEDITAAVERMAGMGAEVFVGDIPPTSVMPEWRLQRGVEIAAAPPEEQDATAARLDAEVAIVDERTRIANEALYAAAARFDNVHRVPTAQAVLDIIDEPLVVDGERLTIEMFGGLVGLDGVHFTDTGSAHTANLVIAVMNEALGLDVPLVDLAPVLAADRESTAAFVEAGVPIDDCLR